MKTSELTGAALDYAVQLALGIPSGWVLFIHPVTGKATLNRSTGNAPCEFDEVALAYSTDWAQGGPIIEREKISIRQWVNVPVVHAYMPEGEWKSDAISPLTAAMRCYVASKLGDEVEIPEKLL
jgi:hypothetical protein